MRQINLLPWRERRLEAMKRTFVMQTVFTVVVVIFIVLAAHKSLTQRLVKQEGVNRILEQHIADLNTQVTEVDQFRERQAVVRDRMRVIADLQNERASVVKNDGRFKCCASLTGPLPLNYWNFRKLHKEFRIQFR